MMARLGLCALLLLLLPAVALAQILPGGTIESCGSPPTPGAAPAALTTWGYQSLQVGRAASVGLTTPAQPATGSRGLLWVAVGTTATAPSVTYGTNYRSDGTNPTVTLGTGGMTVTGQVIVVCNNALSKIKLIGNGTSDVIWGWEFYGW
jgi:hypothetical protein